MNALEIAGLKQPVEGPPKSAAIALKIFGALVIKQPRHANYKNITDGSPAVSCPERFPHGNAASS